MATTPAGSAAWAPKTWPSPAPPNPPPRRGAPGGCSPPRAVPLSNRARRQSLRGDAVVIPLLGEQVKARSLPLIPLLGERVRVRGLPVEIPPPARIPRLSFLEERNRAGRQPPQVRAPLNPSPGGRATVCGVKGWSEGSPSYPSPEGEQPCAAPSSAGLRQSYPSPAGEGRVRGLPVPAHPRQSNRARRQGLG